MKRRKKRKKTNKWRHHNRVRGRDAERIMPGYVTYFGCGGETSIS